MWIFCRENNEKVAFIFENTGEYKTDGASDPRERWEGIVLKSFEEDNERTFCGEGQTIQPLKDLCKHLEPHEIVAYKLLGKLPIDMKD